MLVLVEAAQVPLLVHQIVQILDKVGQVLILVKKVALVLGLVEAPIL